MSQCNEKAHACGSRREFLVRTLTAAGGAMVGLSIAANAADAPATPPVAATTTTTTTTTTATSSDVILELSAHPALAKIGGSEIIDSPAGKILVMRTGQDTFAATSAICTHKKGPLTYDAKSGKIVCDTHGALFSTDGKVVEGPAKIDLKSYVSGPAAVLHLADKPAATEAAK